MKMIPASKSLSYRIDSASAYQWCLVYRDSEVMQTTVVFWGILRSDGIQYGLMMRHRPRHREGVYVFVDGRKQTMDGF